MRIFPLLGLASLLTQSPLHAAQAAFSEDGKSIFTPNADGLDVIHLDTGKIESVVPAGIKDIRSICPAGKGEFYMTSGKALWRWKPGKKPAVLVEKAEDGYEFADVTCLPETGAVVILGNIQVDSRNYNSLFYKPNAKHHSVKLKERYLADAAILAPEFLPDGTILFSAEGDLWHGDFEMETIPPEDDEPERLVGSLMAYRYAPIAERYNDSGTSSELGVDKVAYGAGKVFVHLGRMGGSGRGHLTTLVAPAVRKDGDFPVHNKAADYVRTLQSAQTLFDCPSLSAICSSSDHKQVYFSTETDSVTTHFLAKADVQEGKPIAFRTGDKILIEP